MHKIAVVVPCYKVASTVADVLKKIGPEVSAIYFIDDGCPEDSTTAIQNASNQDDRVKVIKHKENQGVGAAVLTGYNAAIKDGCDIIVKIDGDGQMDPAMVSQMAQPIIDGQADYVKGNRFYYLRNITKMPAARLFGNAGLSFLTKISSGYWNLFDPTCGYTAIHAAVAEILPHEKIRKRFFFESDMLYQLNLLRAVINEIPMKVIYGKEKSNLSPAKSLLQFPILHLKNFLKRLVYNYFVRNFSVASVDLVLGILLCGFSVIFGISKLIYNAHHDFRMNSGTVMVLSVLMIIGFQMLLGFVNFDISDVPKNSIHNRLPRQKK